MTECAVAWAAEGLEPFVEEERVQAAARAALDHGQRKDAWVSIVFVREPDLTAMHAEHLGDPTPTDVITFDLGDVDADDDEESPSGELYISVDRALEVAAERGLDAASELLLYVVHGCLHLSGYDDHADDERAAMRVAERAVLDRLGVVLGDGPHEYDVR